MSQRRYERKSLKPKERKFVQWAMKWALRPWESWSSRRQEKEKLRRALRPWFGYGHRGDEDSTDVHQLHREAGDLLRFALGEANATTVRIGELKQLNKVRLEARQSEKRRELLITTIHGAGLRESVLATLARYLDRHGLPLPKCSEPTCKKVFVRHDPRQTFCSRRCADRSTSRKHRQEKRKEYNEKRKANMKARYRRQKLGG